MRSIPMPCESPSSDYQLFPNTERSSLRINLPLTSLMGLLEHAGGDEVYVYCYVIDTIETEGNRFHQTGSAPNFQGNMISLCTCKHFMRTFRGPDRWVGQWVAGFTGLSKDRRTNFLVYLMEVGFAFKSHFDLWISPEIPEQVKHSKDASRDRFGDIYNPLKSLKEAEQFMSSNYTPPLKGHVHFPQPDWNKDINYFGCGKRRPALLVGNPIRSFLWERPTIFWNQGSIGRGQMKKKLHEFLNGLNGQ